MAVSVKADGLAIIKKIGIKQDLFDWLTLNDVSADFDGSQLTLSKNGKLGGTIPVTLTQTAQLQSGNLHPVTKSKLSSEVQSVILYMMEKMPTPHSAAPMTLAAVAELPDAQPAPGALDLLNKQVKKITADPLKMSVAELSQLVEAKGLKIVSPTEATKSITKSEKVAIPYTTDWPVFPQEKMKTAETVKLADATQMYQPVSATTQGSRYFVVAAIPDLKLAARYQGQTLSIRAEGAGLEKHKARLVEAGLTCTGDYASVHVQCPSDLLARKTLGAVLVGSGLVFETLFPELDILKEVGS